MANAAADPEMPQVGAGLARLIDRAFLTAYLLTASVQQSEDATREAIDSWDPDEQPDETFLHNVLEAATRAHNPLGSSNGDRAGSNLPTELKAVLRLAPQLRGCFVLRILMGLPSKVCGQFLRLHSHQVDEYACNALQNLVASS